MGRDRQVLLLSTSCQHLPVSGKQTPSGGRGERSDIGSGHNELL